MDKIIAVWGNSGSGKTTFCAMLARKLTQDKAKAIIISPDMNTPVLPILFPKAQIPRVKSIGTLFTTPKVNSTLLADKVVLYQPYPFFGAAGFVSGDTPLSYQEPTYQCVKEIIQAASDLVNYVIIDCTSSVVSVFTATAIEQSDVVIRILTPDLFGINYFKAHQPILQEPHYKLDQHISLAGQARPYQAIEEMGHLIGGFRGVLPFNKEIQKCAVSGEIFNALHCCGQRYLDALNDVVKIIKPIGINKKTGTEVKNDEQFK